MDGASSDSFEVDHLITTLFSADTAMSLANFINESTPLAVSMFVSMIGVTAAIISEAHEITREADGAKRREVARRILISAVPPNICLGAFAFDTWALTTLAANDTKASDFFNITGKLNAVTLIILVHVFLYLWMLGWTGIVRGSDAQPAGIGAGAGVELGLGCAALISCILFQVY